MAAVAVGVLVGVVWRQVKDRAAPVAGLVLAGAGLVGLADVIALPNEVLIGCGALALGGLVADRFRWALTGAATALPGAVILSTAPGVPTDWTRILIIVTVCVGGTAMADVDRRFRNTGLGPVLLALTIAGAYATVPETRRTLVLVGAALPLPLLGWPAPLASLGRAGCYPAVGLLMWCVALDGPFRQGSLIGAAACLGLFLVEPVAHRLAGRRSPIKGIPDEPRWLWVIVVAAGHLALVYVASRVAGLRDTAGEAGAIALVAAGAAVVALYALAQRAPVDPVRRRRRRPPDGVLVSSPPGSGPVDPQPDP